jgi:hypothetical protein
MCLMPGSRAGYSIWGILTGGINLLVVSLILLSLFAIKDKRLNQHLSVLARAWIIPYTITALLVSLVVDASLGEWALSNGVHSIPWTKPLGFYIQGQLYFAVPLGALSLLCTGLYLKKLPTDSQQNRI